MRIAASLLAIPHLVAADAGPLPPMPELRVPQAALAPRVAADAGDPAWSTAAWIDALPLSRSPDAASLTPQATRVGVLWTPEALHVRFVCVDTEPLAWTRTRDDHPYKGDVCEIFLDPVGDARWYLELQVAPNNAVLDQWLALTAEGRSTMDGMLDGAVLARDFWTSLEWTMPGLRTAAARTADGWMADLAVPAESTLRRLGTTTFASGSTLKANFLRYDWQPARREDPRTLVAQNWSVVMRGCPHISPQRMGTLILE